MSQTWDYIAKLVCIGDSATGKSSLTIRLCEGRFAARHDVTIGVEFGSRLVTVKANDEGSEGGVTSKQMKLSLWDTAGQETYKAVTRSYFRGASGALLVFDITRRSTFLHAIDWLNDLRQIAEENIVIVLVGNKADLVTPPTGGESKREVSQVEAEEWCRANRVVRYVETSAKDGQGVEDAFQDMAQRIYQGIVQGRYDLNDRRSGVRGPGRQARSRAVDVSRSPPSSRQSCC